MEATIALADWSSTAANNSTVLGVNIAEGCPAANLNNALRQALADVAGGINISVLGTFLASSSLANARTALGVSGGSTSLNNFGALTNSANSLPYMTGSDAWSTTTLSAFMRTVLDDGDAATAMTTLGGVSVVASSIAATTGYIKLNISGTTFILQWKDATASGNTTTAVSFPTTYSSWAKAWLAGGENDTTLGANHPAIVRDSTTTSGCTVVNGRSNSVGVTIFAIGV